MNKVKGLLAAAALVLTAQAAHSADAVSVGFTQLSETVKYGDLDLNRDEGVGALYQRLNRAARSVCAPLRAREMHRAKQYRGCLSEALANAVSDVNQPLLTELHRSNGSQSARAIVAKR